MKKMISLAIVIFLATVSIGQISKTVQLDTPGTLSSVLTAEEIIEVTNLTITGNIDARDFKTMRDIMPVLAVIDLSGATIVEYSGTGGTNGNSSFMTFNAANTIPIRSFSANPPYTYAAKLTLTTVILPSSVTAIKNEAFSNCSNLRSINFPTNLSIIENYCFMGCLSLENIQIPSSITSIGTNAFSNIKADINVDSGNQNYSSIEGVLYNKNKTTLIQCPVLKTGSFTIPSSVSKIGNRAFYYCRQLTSIEIPSSVTIFENGNVWNSGAFYACSGLTTINIPASVTEIGRETFAECINITSIYVNSASPVDLSSSPEVFTNIDKMNSKLYVPFGTKTAYQAADQWQDFTNIVELEPEINIPLNVTAGGLAALLPQSVRDTLTYLALAGTIDARDFKTMRDSLPLLSHIDLSAANIVDYTGTEGTGGIISTLYPANEIPQYAFCTKSEVGKTSLRSIFLPTSVSSIATYAFKNCFNLSTIPFPNSLTLIGDRSFWNCFNIVSLTIPKSVTKIGRTAFNNCVNLSSVTFEAPSSLTEIGIWAFGYCTKLRSLTIPSTVTSIGEVAFSKSVTSVIVDPGNPNYSSLDGALFNKDKSTLLYCPLTNVGTYTIPSTVKTVGVDAFYSCSGLTSVTIPSGLTTLGNWAFEECAGLTNLSLPASLDSIGNQAFYNCTGLTYLYANNPIPVDLSSKTDVFFGIDKSTCTLFVPAGTKSLYAEAPQWQDFQNIIEMMPVEMTYVPDDSFEQALINLGYDSGSLNDSVPTFNISSVATLNVSGKNIADLTGIEAFSNLQTLQCYSNKLSQLNVSSNLSLLNLVCDDNLLTNIDVTNNSELQSLSFSRNYSMTSIDVSKNQKLNTLWCDNSKIESLNLANNPLLVTLYCNKTLLSNLDISKNLKIFDLNATGNPNLFCIQVYDQAIAETKKSWQKDAHASYSTDCAGLMSKVTYIPDDNFEQAIIDLGFDSGPLNDSVPTSKIVTVKSLSLQNKNIADLTGIEDFSSLEKLYLSGNKLTSLDLSQNTKLKVLHCQSNQLTSLDISKNTALTEIAPNFNQLTTLDLSSNPGLIKVFCQSNQLTVLDVSNNKALITLTCGSNQLTDLNVSNNSALIYLACENNKIENLDLSNNHSLVNLTCNKNNLYKINLQNGNNANTIGPNKGLNAIENPNLLCIQVDNPELAATYTNWLKDPQTSYSSFCNVAPFASAGPDQIVNENTVVTLDGSASFDMDGDSISFQWDGPQKIVLNSFSVTNPEFTAPEVATDTTLMFTLTVNDGKTNSMADTVYVTIKQVNKAPVANAGSNIRIEELKSFTLSGSKSSDPDSDKLSFRWIIPTQLVTDSKTAEKISVTAPEVKTDTTFTVYLIVNDGITESEPDKLLITVVNVNKPPVASAGNDIVAIENASVMLNGDKSFDLDDDQLEYEWIAPSGIELSATNIANPTFIAPDVTSDSALTFILSVFDGLVYSMPDSVTVTIKKENQIPVADAGGDITADENTEVQLDGTGSFDSDKDALLFNWVAPIGIILNSETSINPTFTAPKVSKDTTYLITLTVSDGLSNSLVDSVYVFVKNTNQAPVANIGENREAIANSVVNFDGSLSYDPDGDTLSFQWSAPAGIELNAENSSKCSATMPDVSEPTEFVFGLIVSDGYLLSEKKSIIITVVPQTAEVTLSAKLNGAAVPPSSVEYDFYLKNDGVFEWQNLSKVNAGASSKFNLTKGNWIVLASPVAGGTQFAPTYFGDKLNWGDATPIEITDYNPISAVINCIPVDTITESGEFTIEGVITQTAGTKSGVYFNTTKEGTPVSGVVVNLYQETKLVPAAFAVTDGNGYYAFNHIPKGKYFITVELPGFEPEEEFKIELENESQAVLEMNFTVVTESGVITDVTTSYNRLLFYPNPFNNEIKIAGQIDIEKLIIRNITGQSVVTVVHPESSITTEFLNPGIYFITAYDKNDCILSTNKLVKNK